MPNASVGPPERTAVVGVRFKAAKMKIAVLGLTGHVGKLFAERALAAGHELSAVVRNPAKLAEFAPGVRAVKGDLLSSDLAPLVEAFQGVDVVVAMIGMTSGNDSPNMCVVVVSHTEASASASRR